MFKTYQYDGYFLTTDAVPEDSSYINSFDVTLEEVVMIDAGANLENIDGTLHIEEITPTE